MTKAERERAVGSERDRAIAEAVLRSPRVRIPCALCEAACFTDPGCGEPYCGVDLDAIIAAVDAQHPAPALPREVAMRVAEEVLHTTGLAAIGKGPPADLAAIVSRHLPTDEEREAEGAVVDLAIKLRAAWHDHPTAAAHYVALAADRLLAIRAKRGAR